MFLPPRKIESKFLEETKIWIIFLLSDCFSLSISYSHEQEIKENTFIPTFIFLAEK